jgi:hypothetical protein
VQGTGSDRAVESGRPPTGGPVRSDWKEQTSFPSHYSPIDLRSIAGRTLTFFPESERTGPPVGVRPHSTARDGRTSAGRMPAVRAVT